jgi:membrane-bound ClpP family serine protease
VTTFLIIGFVGLAVLVVSLVLGDLLEGALGALGGDVFSSAVLGGFVAAFGFGAGISTELVPEPAALGIGVAAGIAFGWFAWWLTRLVRDGSSDATLTTDDTVGREGKVVSSIPEDGYGTVRILVGGHSVQLNARATTLLEPGTAVHVTEVLSPTAVEVAPIWGGLPPASA